MDIVLITTSFADSAILHLEHHITHQFQRGMNVESVEKPFSADITTARIVPRNWDF